MVITLWTLSFFSVKSDRRNPKFYIQNAFAYDCLHNSNCIDTWISFWAFYSLHWSVYLCLFQYCTAVIIITLQQEFTSGKANSFFFFSSILAFLGSLFFLIHFRNSFSYLYQMFICI